MARDRYESPSMPHSESGLSTDTFCITMRTSFTGTTRGALRMPPQTLKDLCLALNRLNLNPRSQRGHPTTQQGRRLCSEWRSGLRPVHRSLARLCTAVWHATWGRPNSVQNTKFGTLRYYSYSMSENVGPVPLSDSLTLHSHLQPGGLLAAATTLGAA